MRSRVRCQRSGSKFLLDQSVQVLGDRWIVEALDNFVQKTRDNETLRHWDGDTSGAQVEELVFIDLPGRCAVGATDVVRENFEAGHGVGFCVVTQQKVANFLICIGEMGVRFYSD